MVGDISGAEVTTGGADTAPAPALAPASALAPAPALALSSRAPLRYGRIVVIGGGCYGSWYAQQLARATARGALVANEIVVVDRDPACAVAIALRDHVYGVAPVRLEVAEWANYVRDWLAGGVDTVRHDTMVPSPLMPHLCLDWLMARAQLRWPARTVSVQALPSLPPTPWERAAPDGRHYVSFATWMCPINCIEPAKCPETKGVRDWSLPPTLRKYVADQHGALDGPLIFHCTHRTYGVGMIDAADIAGADESLAHGSNEFPLRVLVGTVSHCHGALGVLTVA